MDKTYLIELVRDVTSWEQRDGTCHNRYLKPKHCGEIREKLNFKVKY